MNRQLSSTDVVLRVLSSLPQANSIRAERMHWAAERMAGLQRPQWEAAVRDLRGLTTPEVSVLVNEARGVYEPRSSARTIARSKLLERMPELSSRHPALDVALPFAATLLTQGHGSFALDLTHAVASARLEPDVERPWLQIDPAIQFVRMPSAAGAERVGIAYVRPVADAEAAAVACGDAALALSLAAYAAVADGVLNSRPEALFVLNVVAPGLEAWAPLLRASPAVAESVRVALVQAHWPELPPISLRPSLQAYDASLVRDALRVGEGFWQRCVRGAAVPALPPARVRAAAFPEGVGERARGLAEQVVCMDLLVQGLSERMEVQRQSLCTLAAEAELSAGTHGLGSTHIEVTDRLDVETAAAELQARGIDPRSWCAIDWDVDGMRAALEGLGVDVTGFARAGEPDVARMMGELGPDARAFLVREVSVAASAEFAEARPERVAEELVGNVSDVVFEQLVLGGATTERPGQPGAEAA